MRTASVVVTCAALACATSCAVHYEPAHPPETTQATSPPERAWPAPYEHLRVLNNLVTELLSTSIREDSATYTFQNPRSGWVFIAVSSAGPNAKPMRILLDAQANALVPRPNPDSGAQEVMAKLGEGEHQLKVASARGSHLDVRAVPELAYCYYFANPNIAPYGPYDKAFLDRYVAPNVNTYVTSGLPPDADFTEWTREGRKWITNTSLPGISGNPVPAPEVLAAWLATPGIKDPRIGGLIVDEFMTRSPEHYASWQQAVESLYAAPEFQGKTYYAFCGNLYKQPHSLEFAKDLLKHNGVFAIERYLCEEPTREIAERWTHRQFAETLSEWEAALPGSAKRIEFVLGFMSAPPENLDVDPAKNYNVLTEIQLNHLANDPACFGVYGLMEYSASYADEESIRWAYRLFRHYAIEGKRKFLSDAPYELDHIANSDFADGLTSWAVDGATASSVSVGHMEGWSWIEGRYPRTKQGDTFAVMTRQKERPNMLRQTLRNLRAGHAYSLRLIAADPQHLDAKQDIGLAVRITDGENDLIDPKLSVRTLYPSNYAHTLAKYNADHPAWFTYVRLVFRPRTSSAEVTICDWVDAKTPGGAIDGQTAVNFVQVQPYFEP